MKKFGIDQQHQSHTWKRYLQFARKTYIVVLIIFFCIFTFYDKVTEIIFAKNSIDIFNEDLPQIAVYFWTIDKEFSKFLLTIDDIGKAYVRGENIFIEKNNQIDYAWEYIRTHKNYLQKVGFHNYDYLFQLLGELRPHKEEIFQLLGKDKPFNYLVLLQNTNEKRPNGGFFGSFAFIRINKGFIEKLEILDSYYPNFIAPNSFIYPPQRTYNFIPDQKIGFIAANKFGFTDMDGETIKRLYENIFSRDYDTQKVEETIDPKIKETVFNKDIKGIIFLRSDFMEYIIPRFQKIARERQFINASIDLIRGEERANKKEKYIQEVKDFFAGNKTTILKNTVNQLPDILNNNFIQIYLSNTSPDIQHIIKKYNLSTTYKTGTLYARDASNSFNKINSFVSKHISIVDSKNRIIRESTNDTIPLSGLSAGTYTIHIEYQLNVPQSYYDFIGTLEQKYQIQLTQRERGIIGLEPARDFTTGEPRRFSSRGILYFPPNTKINSINGPLENKALFTAPFAQGVTYQIRNNMNTTKQTVDISFTLP